ncbi:hypothetical protein KEM54_001681 [Ascosphaera aggregata]|nr:hypothetical protein KEM54_001681 [Ascosphaera aggregata]
MSFFIRNPSTGTLRAFSAIQKSARTRPVILSSSSRARIGITAPVVSTPALPSQTRRHFARRSYSSEPAGGDAKSTVGVKARAYSRMGGGDLPWLIGAIAVTLPVAYLMLRPMLLKSKDDHGDHNEEANHKESANEDSGDESDTAPPEETSQEEEKHDEVSDQKSEAIADETSIEQQTSSSAEDEHQQNNNNNNNNKTDGIETANEKIANDGFPHSTPPNEDTFPDKSSDQPTEGTRESIKDNGDAPKQDEKGEEKVEDESTSAKEANKPPKKDAVRDEVTPAESSSRQQKEDGSSA